MIRLDPHPAPTLTRSSRDRNTAVEAASCIHSYSKGLSRRGPTAFFSRGQRADFEMPVQFLATKQLPPLL